MVILSAIHFSTCFQVQPLYGVVNHVLKKNIIIRYSDMNIIIVWSIL